MAIHYTVMRLPTSGHFKLSPIKPKKPEMYLDPNLKCPKCCSKDINYYLYPDMVDVVSLVVTNGSLDLDLRFCIKIVLFVVQLLKLLMDGRNSVVKNANQKYS